MKNAYGEEAKKRWRWVQTFYGDSCEDVDNRINEVARFTGAKIIQITSCIQKNALRGDSYIVSVIFEARAKNHDHAPD